MDRILSLFDWSSYSINILVGAGSVVILSIVIVTVVLALKRRINPLRRARQHFEKGHYERSLVGTSIALERNPENREALLLRADAESALGRYADAARDYYLIIHRKKPGDGIDVLEVKKKLLRPLYEEEKLLELHNLCGEIRKSEPNSPEAIYYLGLLYLGQMYYDRAAEQLAALARNRPRMHEARFALGLALCQSGKYDDALRALTQAAELELNLLYRLCCATMWYLKDDFKGCMELLRTVPQREDAFDSRKQYLYSLRLRAFCNYRLGRYERALHTLQVLYNLRRGAGKRLANLYDRRDAGIARGRPEDTHTEAKVESALSGYYRLREVAAEEGRVQTSSGGSRRFLDLDGLSPVTESALDLGFTMLRSGNIEAAIDFFTKLREEHPELLGLGRIIQLIGTEQERVRSSREDGPRSLSKKSTERVVRGGGRGYRLWEYIESWEKNAIRPFHLLIMAGLTSGKMLSPGVLLSKKK